MGGFSWRSARLFEYNNSGPGAGVNANRPQLTSSQATDYTAAKYLAGTDGWNPTA
jgi:pectinesterase